MPRNPTGCFVHVSGWASLKCNKSPSSFGFPLGRLANLVAICMYLLEGSYPFGLCLQANKANSGCYLDRFFSSSLFSFFFL